MKNFHRSLLAAAMACAAVDAVPQAVPITTWTRIASDGAAFTLPGASVVRYGVPGHWLNSIVPGTSGTCTLAALALTADPAPGQVKQCERRDGPVLALDLQGGPTTHKFGLQVDKASLAAAQAAAKLKPGVAYSTIFPKVAPFPAGQPGNLRPSGFMRFDGGPDGSSFAFNEGAVRPFCNPTHYGYFDPIAHPGEPDAAHLHTFFGNSAIDAYSTSENLRTRNRPKSSCTGGMSNGSAYWVPTLLNKTTRAVIPPSRPILMYYKSIAWPYLQNNPKLESLPNGFKMITGDATRTVTDPNVTYMTCAVANTGTDSGITLTADDHHVFGPGMAQCNQAGWIVWQRLQFPTCWNGELDSANHRSHVTFPIPSPLGGSARNIICPTTHPLAILNLVEIVKYEVSPTNHPGMWALSSDAYLNNPGNTLVPGYSAHADYMFGWDKAISDTFHQLCLREGRDCGSWGPGDGRSAFSFQGNLDN